MAKDDIYLGEEMGRLKIESAKINPDIKDENFTTPQKRNVFSRSCVRSFKCPCYTQNKNKNISITKKKHNQILKEPVLKLLQTRKNASKRDECQSVRRKCSANTLFADNLNLCALVDNCNQLRISAVSNEPKLSNMELNNQTQWWKTTRSCTKQSKEVVPSKSQAGSCSQEALNPPCDVTIDELASYFETLVHIPKKMSSMAEMMYI